MADEWEFQIGDILQFWSQNAVDDGLRIIHDIDYERGIYLYETLWSGDMQQGSKEFVEGIDPDDGTRYYTKVG